MGYLYRHISYITRHANVIKLCISNNNKFESKLTNNPMKAYCTHPKKEWRLDRWCMYRERWGRLTLEISLFFVHYFLHRLFNLLEVHCYWGQILLKISLTFYLYSKNKSKTHAHNRPKGCKKWRCHVFVSCSVVVVPLLSRVQLCDPMDCSAPGSCVPYYLLEFAQVHVHSQAKQTCLCSSEQGNSFWYKFVSQDTLTTKTSFEWIDECVFACNQNIDTISHTVYI